MRAIVGLGVFLLLLSAPVAGQRGGGGGGGMPGGGGGMPGGGGQPMAVEAEQPAVPAEDLGSVEGNIYDAVSGVPLARAQLTMSSTSGGRRNRLTAVSDAAGRFRFPDVEPGQYTLTASRNLYASQTYGQSSGGGGTARIIVARQQSVKSINMKLQPAAVVTGRVLDEHGEPVPYARVSASRYRYVNGAREMVSAGGSVTTDDRGEYRMFGLTAGKYYISVDYGTRLGPGFGGMRGGGQQQQEADTAYPTLYWPSALDPAQTAPIALRSGEERGGVDFRLTQIQAVRVRGKVVLAEGGAAPRDTMVTLLPSGSGAFGASVQRSNPINQTTGEFEVARVFPGSYILSATTRRSTEGLYAREVLQVGGNDIDDLLVALRPGVSLAGVVRIEGASPSDLSTESMRVSLMPTEATGFRAGTASVDAAGSFEMQGLAPGRYQMRITRLPTNGYLKSARLGDADALSNGMEIGSTVPGPVSLVVSLKAGLVTGAVFDDAKDPVPGATVVLVPEQSKRNRMDLFQQASTDQYGRFTLNGIAPGAYKLFAFGNVESGAYQDPVFLEPFEDDGEKIKVDESGSAAVELKLLLVAGSGT